MTETIQLSCEHIEWDKSNPWSKCGTNTNVEAVYDFGNTRLALCNQCHAVILGEIMQGILNKFARQMGSRVITKNVQG